MRTDAPIRRMLLQQAAEHKIPVSGIFELTPRCNLRCRMCYIRMSPEEMACRGRERSTEEWLALAEEAREAGLILLLLTGGEPLLRQDFPTLYRALIRMGFSVSINTNGTLLDESLAELFRELPPATVNLTLYGAGPEAYEALCGDAGAFERAVRAVDLLQKNGNTLALNTTVTERNRSELPAIAAFANERGLPLRTVTYLFPPLRRGGPDFQRMPAVEAGRLAALSRKLTDKPEEYAARVAALKAKLPDPGVPEDCLSGSRDGLRCVAGNCQFWVAWNGEMYPCGMLPEPTVYPFRDGFLPAWEALSAQSARLPSAKQCGSCELRSWCPACAAMAKAETGRTDGIPNYACRLTAAYCRSLCETE